MTGVHEQGAVFRSGANRLIGVASIPGSYGEVGVIILVGGPQYRVGSHRHFTLLARELAKSGIASFRFDYAGMGDSEGEKQEFHNVAPDIESALECFMAMAPKLSSVVLWGLCDAASMAMMFAHRDSRVSGLVLLNPWVHLGDFSPEVKLSHYYMPLLKGGAAWRRFFSGQIRVVPSLRELGADISRALRSSLSEILHTSPQHPFLEAMLVGLQSFGGKVLIVLSEDDLTAQEFLRLVRTDAGWDKAIANTRVTVSEVAGADHTFSGQAGRGEVMELTVNLVNDVAGSQAESA